MTMTHQEMQFVADAATTALMQRLAPLEAEVEELREAVERQGESIAVLNGNDHDIAAELTRLKQTLHRVRTAFDQEAGQ